MGKRDRRRRPGMLQRRLYRAPVVLYRIGLGGLMPGQVMLTTVGRKSRRPRRVVVDLLKRDAATDTYYVASGYGARSDWYRNLEADPELEVQAGRRKFGARATVLPQEEAEQMVLDLWRRHGRLYRLYYDWGLRFVGLRGRTEEEIRAAAREMRVVALRREGEG
jgi:deazaflavin-dependent oxidoreductase (nitroreductase family)